MPKPKKATTAAPKPIPAGKSVHDNVTYGDLIAAGLLRARTEKDDKKDQ